ncbi:uncharacterized protein METZ01_LOCUS88465 [marine metagenome]|uniref:DUF885 domain-containing protein n=1 Tax=marine metagenome TaxID=408172 RepID=A0A381V6I4_9ZZZZ
MKILRWAGYLFAIFLLVCSAYLVNLFFMKPFSLDHYLAKNLVVRFIDTPEGLTYLGVVDKFNWITGHLSELSIKGKDDIFEEIQKAKDQRSIISSYETSDLSEEQRITQKIALFSLENEIQEGEEFTYHNYPVNQIGGLHLNLVEFMTDIHPLRSLSEAEYYVDRLNLFDEVFDAALEILEEQKKSGIFPPEFVYHHVIRQLNKFLNYSYEENPLYVSFFRKIEPLSFSDSIQENFQDKLKLAIDSSVNPGFQSLLSFMEETLPSANQHHGVWSLPNGDEFYSLRLKVYTTTNYSAEEIHSTGLKEVERISAKMRSILTTLGYGTEESVGTLMNLLNEDPKFLYEDTPDRKELVVADYAKIVSETELVIKDYFYKMPEAKVEVRAVPEYSEENQAGGYYMSPALDGSRPGVFYANLYDIKQTPTYSMRTLAFHEAIPGHHLQNALGMENEDLSLYRKFGYYTSAFGEGWALYSEKLAVEAGLTKDLYDELGVLQSELFRAVRLVVDTGIHFKRWTREEAMLYMKDITGMSDTEVVTEIERYIVWPGQACSYKVGMLKILELRERAKKELGDKFDIRDFHSAVLDHGEPPLFIVENFVDQMIEESL